MCFAIGFPTAVGATDFGVNSFHVKDFRFCVFGQTEYKTHVRLLSDLFYGDSTVMFQKCEKDFKKTSKIIVCVKKIIQRYLNGGHRHKR